ncbi:MAG TPA: ATP-binding protein [Streptosporangiaceae bacterium]|nr:ATP-binding protein [Streptosporangiaceae bacterium]
MAVAVSCASDATEDLARMAGAAVLGSLTIPGRTDQVRAAREFVGKALGKLETITDTAVLLTSELVTNAVLHSRSAQAGGSVLIVVLEIADGIRVEVTDNGSDTSSPAVKGDTFASDGHGLYLVEAMARQWGFLRGAAGTTVWFQLGPARPGGPGHRPAGRARPGPGQPRSGPQRLAQAARLG